MNGEEQLLIFANLLLAIQDKFVRLPHNLPRLAERTVSQLQEVPVGLHLADLRNGLAAQAKPCGKQGSRNA
jgi:hypothetical protein